MSLVVSCRDCVHPTNPCQIVQWRVGSCRECCDDLVSRHLAEHPDHNVQITGSVSDTPLGDVPQRIERLFGRKIA